MLRSAIRSRRCSLASHDGIDPALAVDRERTSMRGLLTALRFDMCIAQVCEGRLVRSDELLRTRRLRPFTTVHTGP